MNKWNIIALVMFCGILALFTGCKSQENLPIIYDPNEPWPQEIDEAKTLMESGRANDSIKILKKWVKKNKQSQFADHAHYYMARSYSDQGRYFHAFKSYETLLDQHVSSVHYEPALFEEVELAKKFLAGWKRNLLGIIWVPTRTEGLKILERVEQRWPGSELAASSLLLQAEDYYTHRQYLECQHTCQILIENYINSKEYERAMLLVGEACFAQFIGIRYDTGCLDEALTRFEQYQGAFPLKTGETRVDEYINQIKTYQVMKDFEIVDYYLRTHRQDAALQQLKIITARWTGTEWEKRAQTMLADLALTN